MRRYGELPSKIGICELESDEMLFYQYLPIKLIGNCETRIEERLQWTKDVVVACIADFNKTYGLDVYQDHYVYLTVKKMYQPPGQSFNRPGYHSDGFMTNDINYIWSDKIPTIFNYSNFNLTQDDKISMMEMSQQANDKSVVCHLPNSILKLDQYNIHKVGFTDKLVLRTFIKVTFSKDKYDLKGNSHNHLLDYSWEMRDRKDERNIPQKI